MDEGSPLSPKANAFSIDSLISAAGNATFAKHGSFTTMHYSTVTREMEAISSPWLTQLSHFCDVAAFTTSSLNSLNAPGSYHPHPPHPHSHHPHPHHLSPSPGDPYSSQHEGHFESCPSAPQAACYPPYSGPKQRRATRAPRAAPLPPRPHLPPLRRRRRISLW
ncbi:hypothetical protein AMELA_G00236680 [Ameiurus melas]|uniref:Uncharacterized protein n=1 Tax=Ameiurus melas TaxID=219545 RepID=A0A7J5ZUN9_AMEME|nr:hypothetical protein AMELA_G00236680 [Ameiurus melas]